MANPTCCKTGRSGITFVRDIEAAPLAGPGQTDSELRRTFFHLPPSFTHRKPFTWVIWLQRPGDVVGPYLRRLSIPDQIDESEGNAILVAPQLSRRAGEALPGRFSTPGGLRDFLNEAAVVAEAELGIPPGSLPPTAPVILVAHGESDAVAERILAAEGREIKIAGVLLLAPVLASPDGLAEWLSRTPDGGIGCLWTTGNESGVARFKEALSLRHVEILEDIPFGRHPGHAVLRRSASDTARTPLDGAGDAAPLVRFLR